MLAKEILAQCDAIRPNAMTSEEKLRLLWQFDVLMQRQLAHLCVFDAPEETYTQESTLLLEDARSDIYVKYLLSQIDFFNGETGRYNASAVLFNTAYGRFLDEMNRTHPAKRGDITV